MSFNGFIIINKEKGISSAAALSVVKGVIKCKAGHLGTLDPEAEGVLPVALGKATKLFDYLIDKQKTYIAEITFGSTTDTLDCAGTVTATCVNLPDKKAITEALQGLTGEIMQVPPQYSALSTGGVKAYALARRGIEANLAARKVTVYSFKLLYKKEANVYGFEIVCGAGTYIRALARDLGKAVDSLAYMSKLVRTKSGFFEIAKSATLEKIKEDYKKYLISIEEPLAHLPAYRAEEKHFKHLTNGLNITLEGMPKGLFRLYCGEYFLGLAQEQEEKIAIKYYLYDE